MTPAAPTWGDVEAFLRADRWEVVPAASRGGRRQRHIFFEKVLPGDRVLQTHISHDRGATISPGRFGSVLRHQLEVSRADFWQAIETGAPVDRPVDLDAGPPEIPGWVVQVLTRELHMTASDIASLSPSEAENLVYDHWATPRDTNGGTRS